jgi:hypothetical protein
MSPAYRLVSRSFGLRILERQAIVVQNELAQRPKKVLLNSYKSKYEPDTDYNTTSMTDSSWSSDSGSALSSSL